MMTDKEIISTTHAPTPSGPYSQAVRAGEFVFLAGQTSRPIKGSIPDDATQSEQCRQALTNLEAVARAAGGTLQDAVKVTVFLADLEWRAVFDEEYRQLVGARAARSTICAKPPTGMVEVEAILHLPVLTAGPTRTGS